MEFLVMPQTSVQLGRGILLHIHGILEPIVRWFIASTPRPKRYCLPDSPVQVKRNCPL